MAATETEAPVVDDIWKACAYGDLEKLREFVEKDPQLVNKPDATGWALNFINPFRAKLLLIVTRKRPRAEPLYQCFVRSAFRRMLSLPSQGSRLRVYVLGCKVRS